ncbi:hypothetical protein KI809_13335 [Geobacter pelophilus]|uniref:Uncharacterized protein n=1 Tax=Geoanaerobacter pelophilus TaxID=60036 RepID=A0AAW4L2H0_9BACT|nr:hypothetical protein [Geoanaerobacter pelophilus]MBT0665284.1 hypothetical protein [Geoanaerobacter pelophilus]
MSKYKVRFTLTSGNLETAHSCDCQKWIRHLATNKVKMSDLQALFNGKFPAGKMFVLDMLEFLRKSDGVLDRFLIKRGGVQNDDLPSIDNDAVRQLLNNEFPDVVAEIANLEGTKRVIKRRPGTVDMSALKALAKK